MVTPEVVGLVGNVGLSDERGSPEIDSPIAPNGDFAVGPFVLTGPNPQEEEDHRDHRRAVAIEGQGCVRVVVREQARVNGDVHGGNVRSGSGPALLDS
jgi:hypothetical protein